jgi:YHS domain-containing protein
MKFLNAIKTTVFSIGLLVALAALVSPAFADDKKAAAKPYPLDTCLVSDEKLGADANMKTFVFTHEGQEIKLCCKSCQKDFKKEPAKYLKKLEGAGKTDKK